MENRTAIARRRTGPILFGLAAVIVLGAITACFGITVLKQEEPEPILYTARRGNFSHQLELPGTIQSSVNVEIKCEVSQLRTWKPKIETVIPDGSMVKEGDILMTIDASELEERLVLQQIQLLGLESARRGAEMEIAALDYQLQSYKDGELALERLEKESSLYQAREKEKQKKQDLDNSLRLFDLGYISESQLDAELTAYKKANNALELELIKSDVLERFVSKLKILTIEMNLYSAKVKLATTDQSIAHRKDRIKFFQENVDHSTIRAPRDGMVIHVVESDRGWDKQYLQVGTELYKGQTVFRLPNVEMMEVKVTIEEENLSEAAVGTAAEIRIEAVDGAVLAGTLESVRPFAQNEGWAHRDGKRYSGIVSLNPESLAPWKDQIKPGLSAWVTLLITDKPDALFVPAHALITEGDEPAVLVWRDKKAQRRPVKIAAEDDRFAVITEGIAEGDRVICGAKSYWEKYTGKNQSAKNKAGEESASDGTIRE